MPFLPAAVSLFLCFGFSALGLRFFCSQFFLYNYLVFDCDEHLGSQWYFSPLSINFGYFSSNFFFLFAPGPQASVYAQLIGVTWLMMVACSSTVLLSLFPPADLSFFLAISTVKAHLMIIHLTCCCFLALELVFKCWVFKFSKIVTKHTRRNLPPKPVAGYTAQHWVHSQGSATSHHLPTDSFSSCQPESVPSFKCLESLTPISREDHSSSIAVNPTTMTRRDGNSVCPPVTGSSSLGTVLKLSERGATASFF